MDFFQNLIQTEPVLSQAVIQAAIALLASFGLHLSAEQIGGIVALVAAVLALWARARVTPVPSPAATASAPKP